MIVLQPDSSDGTFSTEHILSVIDQHASTIAVVLLPGVQYYTGQYLDMATITAHAHSVSRLNEDDMGIIVGWDLAHAVGNVELHLHDWNVDFAIWCNYKYVNGGPGVIGGLFVHERRGRVDLQNHESHSDNAHGENHGGEDNGVTGKKANSIASGYRHRLAGWWGSDKISRFRMENCKDFRSRLLYIVPSCITFLQKARPNPDCLDFIPLPGAAGYQLSNPSILDICAVLASLSLFEEAGMANLREKSILLTSYLEYLLLHDPPEDPAPSTTTPLNPQDTSSPPTYKIITPTSPSARGAQLSIRFFPEQSSTHLHQGHPDTQRPQDAPTSRTPTLSPGKKEEILSRIMASLERDGVVVDHRRPDVIRVAPVPLYNSFEDVWVFVDRFKAAVREAMSVEGDAARTNGSDKKVEEVQRGLGEDGGDGDGDGDGDGGGGDDGDGDGSVPERALGKKHEGVLDV